MRCGYQRLGAPRAFFLRWSDQISFPNTSYGEDYALGRHFRARYRISQNLRPNSTSAAAGEVTAMQPSA